MVHNFYKLNYILALISGIRTYHNVSESRTSNDTNMNHLITNIRRRAETQQASSRIVQKASQQLDLTYLNRLNIAPKYSAVRRLLIFTNAKLSYRFLYFILVHLAIMKNNKPLNIFSVSVSTAIAAKKQNQFIICCDAE